MTLAHKLMGGAQITTTGTLSGSGTLVIPAGATLVSVTGRGGNGGDDSWYDPGQSAINPTYVNTWDEFTLYNAWPSAGGYEEQVDYVGSGTGPTPSTYHVGTYFNATYAIIQVYEMFQSTGSTMTDPGRDYIPPSSGGGPTVGPSTTATLNGTTRTWAGGYGSGVQGATSTQTLTSTGAGQTLSYNVGSGGTLTYTYTY